MMFVVKWHLDCSIGNGGYMSIGIYSALSGLKVKELELEVVANNIANVNTTGFKQENMTFEAVLAAENPDENNTPFVINSDSKIDFENGPLIRTDNPLDLAIQGEGFFKIQKGEQALYTRNGSFVVNREGMLVTKKGDQVIGANGPIAIPEGMIPEISNSGLISANGEEIGQITLTKVSDLSKMKNIGESLFRPDDDAVLSVDNTSQVFQGNLEQSNTNIMRNLVRLIDVSKQHQAYKKALDNQMKLEQEAVGNLGRVN